MNTPTNMIQRQSFRILLLSTALLLVAAPFADAAPLPAEPGHVVSLNGTWRFKLEQTNSVPLSRDNLNARTPITTSATFEPFYTTDYKEEAGWHDLAVPGNWEMAGYSPATYDQPDNASGFYRLWFEVPQSWKGRLVRLSFDGVQNGAQVWLNGSPVTVDQPSWGRTNYHESGWTAFQVDLTPQVEFGRTNLLALRVTKNTRSADLDSGDYFFLGGVYRPVTLFSVPQTHLADVTVQTRLLAGSSAEVKLLAEVAGSEAATLAMRLDGIAGEAIVKIEQGHAVLTQNVEHPKLWSAEFPNLYQLTVDLKDASGRIIETVSKRVGIREVTIKNAVLLVNGVPVKLAGICRHDVSANEGTAVGPDLWRKDILLMKASNINAIRTSHYPYGAGFYDLCDELGMYVMDELPYCWCPTDDPELQPAFEQRARETIRRDKNHPAVIVWTVGNENKPGRNLQVVADLVKQLDATRPRAVSWFDGNKYQTELSDSHYTVPKRITESATQARKTGQPHIYLENPNTWEIRLAADPGAWERWGAVLQRVWDVCVREDVIPGTFLWEWQDRAVADHCPTKPYCYFPETGIQLVKIKGLVDAFRNPRPWLYDVKMIYSPIRIGALATSSNKVSFAIENRYSFTDLSQLKMSWALEQDGRPIAAGDSPVSLAPLSAGKVELPLPADALAQAEALRLDFVHPAGHNVTGHRFVLKDSPARSRMGAALPAGLLPQFNLVTRRTEHDPQLWRKVTRFPARLTNTVVGPASATTLANLKQLDADVVGGPDGKVVGRVHAQYTEGEFAYRLEWTGDKADVQELGWAFPMPKGCDRFSWDRAARWTVYPEHHISRATGTATPDTMNVPYTRMDRVDAFDFNSTKYNCNWASLTDAAGTGLRVGFDSKHRFHCRAGVADGSQGYVLFVNQQVSPPDDLSKPVVPDFYQTLKAGDIVEGRFRVGSNQAQAHP